MLSRFLLFLLVGLAAASDFAWKQQTVYEYNVYGRTLTSWDDVADQYSGIFIRAKLTAQLKKEGVLTLKLVTPRYARINRELPDDGLAELPESAFHYQPLPMKTHPIEVRIKNGVVSEFYVHKSTPNWEVNMYKSIISQIQVDVKAENKIHSRYNQSPDPKTNQGTFKTMEDTVVGTCETMYEIKDYPEYQFLTKPWIAPLIRPGKGDNTNIMQIVKTKNHTNCVERVNYHYGLQDLEDEPGTTNMADFFSQSSVSNVVLSGSLERHTIQSSMTVSKVIMSPSPTSEQKGTVVSVMNLTLSSMKASTGKPEELTNGVRLTNLVYNYNQGFDSDNTVNEDAPISGTQYHQGQGNKLKVSYRSARRADYDDNDDENDYETIEEGDLEHKYLEQSLQDIPDRKNPPQTPYTPYSIGFEGRAITFDSKINVVEDVIRLSKQVSLELETPTQIPKKDTLDVYAMIVRLIRLAKIQELQQIAAKVQSFKQSVHRFEHNIWTVVRDAIAQAGTFPALNLVKEWIVTGKIAEQEAADVISVLTNNVRYPSDEYMSFYYSLIKSDKVQFQHTLNETAILSFADLVRKVYINHEQAHNRFPVHVFGKLNRTDVVETEYIPFFARLLKQAVIEGHNQKIILYTRVLGNIGHIQIVPVFKPYLEGTTSVTHFQRLTIVTALDKVVMRHPKQIRAVLYKLFANRAEKSEIRALAVHQLMRTIPPADMLQRLAMSTREDTDMHVKATIKTAIETAAALRDPRYLEIAANAKAAVKLLTSETFGIQYGANWLVDYVIKEMDLAYKQSVQSVGSSDSFFSKGLLYSLRTNLQGYTHRTINVHSMVSSIERITQVFLKQTIGGKLEKKNPGSEHKFSAANIARLLKIKEGKKAELEGFFDISNAYYRHFYAFTNNTIMHLPRWIREQTDKVVAGQTFNYTKLFNMYEMTIAVPTATGLPFIFTFENPVVLSMHGKVRANIQPPLVGSDLRLRLPKTVNATIDLNTFASMKTQVRFGFVTPFDHQHHIAGYDKKIQLNLPVHHNIDIDLVNNEIRAEIKPLHDDRDIEILHYSTWVYTAQHDLLELKPIAKTSNIELIRAEQHRNVEAIIGNKNGLVFRLNATTQDKFMDYRWMYEMYQNRETLPLILAPLMEDHLHNTNISIYYDSDMSHARSVVFTFGWDAEFQPGKDNQPEPKFTDVFSKVSSTSNSDKRQEYLIKNAGAGINSAWVGAFDLSIEFPGSKYEAEYNMSGAAAWSIVDRKIRYLYYHTHDDNTQDPYRLCVSSNRNYPKINALDFLYALNYNTTSQERLEIAFGQNCQSDARVNLQTKLWKSEERKQYLRDDPMTHLCAKEMKNGNNLMDACRNMTLRANFMDRFDIDVSYQNVGPRVRNATSKVFNFVRYMGYMNMFQNIFADNKVNDFIKIRTRIEPTFESFNTSIETEHMTTEFRNIRLANYWKSLISFHPERNLKERIQNRLYDHGSKPVCVLDKTAATTFDNKTYELQQLPNTWYVAINNLYNSSQLLRDNTYTVSDYFNDYSILVMQTASQKKQLKIVISGEKQNYEVDLRPSSNRQTPVDVLLNGKTIKVEEHVTYDVEKDLIRLHRTGKGHVMVHLSREIEILFDGERVKIVSNSDYLRDNVRGLCGTNDGKETTDFTTPSNCIVNDPHFFAALYSLDSESSNPKAKELKQRALQAACAEKEHWIAEVITEKELETTGETGNEVPVECQPTKSCTKLQTVLVEENNGQTLCFSLRPMPKCQSPCRSTKKVVKSVDVHCVQKSNVSGMWKEQIAKGGSPDFSQKTATKTIKIKVDQACEK